MYTQQHMRRIESMWNVSEQLHLLFLVFFPVVLSKVGINVTFPKTSTKTNNRKFPRVYLHLYDN